MNSSSVPKAVVENSWVLHKRVGGCAFASFVLLGAPIAAATILEPYVPTIGLQLLAMVVGLGLVHLYGTVARRRWQVSAPDPVAMLAGDLYAITRLKLTADYRLALRRDLPLWERLLHELLYSIKWLGHWLIIIGLGTLLYSGMVAVGILAKP